MGAGWLLAMPWAEHGLESDSHLWLDQDLQKLDVAASRRVGSQALQRLEHGFEFDADDLVLACFSQGGAVALDIRPETEREVPFWRTLAPRAFSLGNG